MQGRAPSLFLVIKNIWRGYGRFSSYSYKCPFVPMHGLLGLILHCVTIKGLYLLRDCTSRLCISITYSFFHVHSIYLLCKQMFFIKLFFNISYQNPPSLFIYMFHPYKPLFFFPFLFPCISSSYVTLKQLGVRTYFVFFKKIKLLILIIGFSEFQMIHLSTIFISFISFI